MTMSSGYPSNALPRMNTSFSKVDVGFRWHLIRTVNPENS